MRVVDLDRDMSDVIPAGSTPDSDYLFERMTHRTLDLADSRPGRRVLDVASGVGQDVIALASRGATAVGAEPSQRMTGLAQLVAERRSGPLPLWVRGWSDALPFANDCFDASICKGAIDHFDRPGAAIAEMARVTRPGGRVVLAIANFESLACRAGRAQDALARDLLRRPPERGRRGYDAPSDHFTRYDLALMREQASRHLQLERVEGISLGWGMPGWSRALGGLPGGLATLALRALDWIARRAPSLADVVVLAGHPQRTGGAGR